MIEYTGAKEIDVIAHSMGVPFVRRALKGGWNTYIKPKIKENDEDYHHYYHLGEPLRNKVAHFIAIAGPNYGVLNCTDKLYSVNFPRGCDTKVGFNPGTVPGDPFPPDMSL